MLKKALNAYGDKADAKEYTVWVRTGANSNVNKSTLLKHCGSLFIIKSANTLGMLPYWKVASPITRRRISADTPPRWNSCAALCSH